MLCVLPAAACLPHAPPPVSDAVFLRRAVAELIAEAEQARDEQVLPRQDLSFARELLLQEERPGVSGDAIFKLLVNPVHNDGWIDAYARWQLLGFEPAWPAKARDFGDEEFEEFLSDLPALLMNPRSDRETIARVNIALSRERVSDPDAAALRELDQSLRTREAEIQNLNRPALELRRWVEERCGLEGHRHHQARLERLGAMVAAGWPVEELKRQIAQRLDQSHRDPALTPPLRARLASQAATLAGRRTPVIESVGVGENNSPRAQFDEAAVYDFEVNEWIRILQGK